MLPWHSCHWIALAERLSDRMDGWVGYQVNSIIGVITRGSVKHYRHCKIKLVERHCQRLMGRIIWGGGLTPVESRSQRIWGGPGTSWLWVPSVGGGWARTSDVWSLGLREFRTFKYFKKFQVPKFGFFKSLQPIYPRQIFDKGST